MSINDTERGNLIQKNENSNQRITLNDNTEKDSFLFVFTPSKIDIDFLCGCSLHCGVRLIAIVFLLGSIMGILSSMANQVIFDNVIAFIVSIFYFIAGIYLFKSTVSYIPRDAEIAYLFYAGLTIFDIFSFICSSVLISLGISNPFGEGNFTLQKFGVFLVGGIINDIIRIYLVWIVFCYFVHIKLKRINLVLLKH